MEANQSNATNVAPRSILPATLSKPMNATKKIVQIRAVSGGDSTSGQTVIFRIPTGLGAGFCVNSSMTLNGRLHVTESAGTWGFKAGGDASALINRVTVSQGQILDQVQNYSLWYNNLLKPYMSSPSYLNISQIAGGGSQCGNMFKPLTTTSSYNTATGAAGVLYDPSANFVYNDTTASNPLYFSFPLVNGLFFNQEQSYIPLSLMSSNIEVILDLNTVANAIWGGNGGTPTEFNVYDLNLIYETVQVDPAYEATLRTSMQGGSLFTIPITSVSSSQVASSTSIQYQMSLNVSSLDCFFHSQILAENIGVGGSNYFTTSTGARYLGATNNDTAKITKRQYLVDGTSVLQVNNNNIDSIMFMETMRAINQNLGDSSLSPIFNVAGNNTLWGSFRGGYYVDGVNLRNFSSGELISCGTPCSLFTYIKEDSLARTTDINYFFALSTQLIVLDGSGSLNLIR